MLLVVGTLVLVALSLFFIYEKKRYNYWPSRGVECDIPFTVFSSLYRTHKLFKSRTPIWEVLRKYYPRAKHAKIFGTYQIYSPKLVICDPELLKHVLVKDFDYFVDKVNFIAFTKEDKILSRMLIFLAGNEWKNIRSKLSPVFSSGKIKVMYNIVSEKADSLTEYCRGNMSETKTVEFRAAVGSFALEVIASCAFGFEAKSPSQENPQLMKMLSDIFIFSFGTVARDIFCKCLPRLASMLKINATNQSILDASEIIKNIIKNRKEKQIKRGDFLDTFIEANLDDTTNVDEKYTLLAQSLIFLFAGYSTVANTASLALYHLAQNLNEQKILRQELQSLQKDGNFSYQELMEAPYLDACLSESMRLLPIGAMLERVCTKDYKLPGTNVVVEKGVTISLFVHSMQHDPEYWDEPEEFRPSRFLPENKHLIVPYTYLPFGIGPRNCIGMRFAQMEVKLVLAKIISAFEVSLPKADVLTFKNITGDLEHLNLIFTQI